MRLLIDTHVWLWWMTEPSRLNDETMTMLADGDNRVYLSVASVWEIVIKHGLGELPLRAEPGHFIPKAMAEDRISGLAIENAHVLRTAHLPWHHRDPFDRLLVAQAQVEDLPILTADPLMLTYDVKVLRAR